MSGKLEIAPPLGTQYGQWIAFDPADILLNGLDIGIGAVREGDGQKTIQALTFAIEFGKHDFAPEGGGFFQHFQGTLEEPFLLWHSTIIVGFFKLPEEGRQFFHVTGIAHLTEIISGADGQPEDALNVGIKGNGGNDRTRTGATDEVLHLQNVVLPPAFFFQDIGGEFTTPTLVDKSEFGTGAFTVILAFQITGVVHENGHQGDFEFARSHDRMHLQNLPMTEHANQAEGGLQGVLQVVVNGIHGLIIFQLAAKHGRDTAHPFLNKSGGLLGEGIPVCIDNDFGDDFRRTGVNTIKGIGLKLEHGDAIKVRKVQFASLEIGVSSARSNLKEGGANNSCRQIVETCLRMGVWQTREMKIGLTGGIGCGKSTVLAKLADRGAAVVNCDLVARQLLQEDGEVRREVTRSLGPEIYDAEGKLQRSLLAKRAFADAEVRNILESILHHRVRCHWQRVIETAGTSLIVVEIPLLFEKKLEKHFDFCVCVEAEPAIRAIRVRNRGWTSQELHLRESAQLPLSEKIRLANYILTNNSSLELLERQIDRLLFILR